jgi:hypothetical protein
MGAASIYGCNIEEHCAFWWVLLREQSGEGEEHCANWLFVERVP